MKIEINLKIILVAILLILLRNIDTYIIFLCFIILHELAHLITGIFIGGVPKKITLNPLGVSLDFYSYGKNKTILRCLFYVSGPLLNLIFSIIFNYLKLDYFLKVKIIYTNLILCIFNLIPILPLDGGKLLNEILKKVIGYNKASIFCIYFSKCLLFIVSFLYAIFLIKFKNIFILFIIIYLWYLFYMEEKSII